MQPHTCATVIDAARSALVPDSPRLADEAKLKGRIRALVRRYDNHG